MLQEIWNQLLNLQPSLPEIVLRLACAMLVGLVIGAEREYTHRPAGMRTHILVALGACVVSVTGELIFHHYSPLGSTPDPARLSAQVIAGVGFLGAGTIMREGATVKGLTTAASVWAVACLGIACGFGYYALAVLGMVFVLVTLTVFEVLQKTLFDPKNSRNQNFAVETGDITKTLNLLNTLAQDQRLTLSRWNATVLESGHLLRFSVQFPPGNLKKRHMQFFDALAADPNSRCLRNEEEPVASK